MLVAERISEISTPRGGSRRRDRVAARTRGSRVTTSSTRDRVGRHGPQRRNTHQETSRAYGSLAEATTVIEYLVDGEGRRVGKRVDGVLEQGWLWSGKLRPVAELDSSGAVSKRFVYADGVNVPELMVTSTATYRLVKDHLGSVRRVVDVASGSVLQAIEYDAWGRVLSDTNPGAQPCGFAGGLYDADTGLVRFGAREYDAETGRWASKDPSRFNGGENIYAHANCDPVNHVDPNGRRFKTIAEAAAENAQAIFDWFSQYWGRDEDDSSDWSMLRTPSDAHPPPDYSKCLGLSGAKKLGCCERLCGLEPNYGPDGEMCPQVESQKDVDCFLACMGFGM